MSTHNNRKYIIENTNTSTSYTAIDILCQPRFGFQLLYLESYVYLLNLNNQQTKKALQQALSYQLTQAKLKPNALKALNTELVKTSATLIANQQKLATAYSQYYQAYDHSDDHEDQDQQAVKLHTLLQNALTTKNITQIDNLKTELLKQTQENPSNFWIAFDIAWIYFHLEQDMVKAEQQLIHAADYALQEKSPLATLILRYLAYTKLILGKDKEALENIQAAIQLSSTKPETESEQPHTIFESVQFHCHVEVPYKQQIRLQKLIRHHPLYYLYIQIDKRLFAHQNIQNLLLRFHIEKLEQIKKCAYEQWQASHFYQSKLPTEFDKDALFDQHFQSYQALLSHQTYPVLNNIGTISKKIVTQLTTAANKQLIMAQTRYVKKIIETQKQWKKVNQIGGILLYAAILVSLASVFLWVAIAMMDSPILINTDWKSLLPKLMIGVSLSAVTGILLMRSTPPMNRKRFKQKRQISKALKEPAQKILK